MNSVGSDDILDVDALFDSKQRVGDESFDPDDRIGDFGMSMSDLDHVEKGRIIPL